MPRTSNKAEKIVEFVNAFIAENGYSPSVREIGEAVGCGLPRPSATIFRLCRKRAYFRLRRPRAASAPW